MSRAKKWPAFSRSFRTAYLKEGARPCQNLLCENIIFTINECQVDHILKRPWCRGAGAHLYNDPRNLRVVCLGCRGNELDHEPSGMLTTNRRRLEKILEAHGQDVHDWARDWMERLGLDPDKG